MKGNRKGTGPGEGLRIIAGALRGRLVPSPPGDGVRPLPARGRESLYSRLHFDLPGAEVVDLFAGSGLFGIEAASRGARRVTFVERDPAVFRALRETVAALGIADLVRLEQGCALERGVPLCDGARVIFADPPFHQGLVPKLLALLAPRAEALHPKAVVALKHEAELPLPELPGFAGPETREFASVGITLYRKVSSIRLPVSS